MKEKMIGSFRVFILCILVHFSQVANAYISGDALVYGEYYRCTSWDLSQGRWGLLLFSDRVINSTLEMILTLLLYALGSILLLDILNVEKGTLCAWLIQIIFISSPHIATYSSFLYVTFPYAVAHMLSILSIWVIRKDKFKNYINILLSTVCLVLSFGIWQSYVSTFVTLTLLIFILTEDNKDRFLGLLKCGAVGVLSIINYTLILKIINKIYNITATDARGFKDALALKIPLFKDFTATICDVYRIFIEYLYGNSVVYNGTKMIIVHILLGITGIVIILKRKDLIGTIGCVLFPISCIIFRLIDDSIVKAPWTYLHTMIYIYILFVVVTFKDKRNNKLLQIVVTILVITVVSNQIYICNVNYNSLNERNRKSYAVAESLFNRILEHEEWGIDVPIVFVGNMEKNEIFCDSNYHYSQILKGWQPQVNEFLPFQKTPWGWGMLINRLYGIGLKYVYGSDNTYQIVIESNEYKNMETFPNEESIKMIEGNLVIKLSD